MNGSMKFWSISHMMALLETASSLNIPCNACDRDFLNRFYHHTKDMVLLNSDLNRNLSKVVTSDQNLNGTPTSG